MPRLISAATGVVLILATLYFATVVVGAPPTATQPAATQSTLNRAHLLGEWTTTYPVADKQRTLTYTFKDDGTFVEHDSNWGRDYGNWQLEGDAVKMHWLGRRGFNGTMQVHKLTDTEWTAEYPAKTLRTYTRPPAKPAANEDPTQRPLDRLRSRP